MIQAPEALNRCPAKNSFLHSEYLDPCLAPNPWKRQFCWVADEFPIARVPWEVYNLLELKHSQMHDCFRTSCHLYWNYFIFGKRITVTSPCTLCSTYFFQEMTWTHSMRNAPIINTCVIRDRQQKGKTRITSICAGMPTFRRLSAECSNKPKIKPQKLKTFHKYKLSHSQVP
jgi:hypothetical protein